MNDRDILERTDWSLGGPLHAFIYLIMDINCSKVCKVYSINYHGDVNQLHNTENQ